MGEDKIDLSDHDNLLFNESLKAKDQMTEENIIPLSPQWLYAKPSKTKTGIAATPGDVCGKEYPGAERSLCITRSSVTRSRVDGLISKDSSCTVTGILNNATNCYMNVVLQSLFNLNASIFNQESHVCGRESCCTCILYRMLTEYKEKTVLDPLLMVNYAKNHLNLGVTKGIMEDPMEFLLQLFRESEIERSFGAKEHRQHQCECGKISKVKGEKFPIFMLAIDDDSVDSVEASLKKYCESKVNKNCGRCKKDVDHVERVIYTKCREYVVIQLVRWHGTAKLKKFINFSNDLLIGANDAGNKRGTLYTLSSVIVHLGEKTEYGHYICYLNTPQGWYIADDQNVKPTEESTVMRVEAYLLVYKKARNAKNDAHHPAGKKTSVFPTKAQLETEDGHHEPGKSTEVPVGRNRVSPKKARPGKGEDRHCGPGKNVEFPVGRKRVSRKKVGSGKGEDRCCGPGKNVGSKHFNPQTGHRHCGRVKNTQFPVGRKRVYPKKDRSGKEEDRYFGDRNKAGLQFPVGRIARYLKKGHYAQRIGTSASVYLTAVLEYLAGEVLESAGNVARYNKKIQITPRHLYLAMRYDEEWVELLAGVIIPSGGLLSTPKVLLDTKTKTQVELTLLGKKPK